MLIYTQPGNCSQCGEPLIESNTHIPGQDPLSVYICQTCEAGINASRVMVQHDTMWMFNEFPKDMSTWDYCVEVFRNTKRKADLWADLKHVLEHGEWTDAKTIESVLTQMSNMEEQINK